MKTDNYYIKDIKIHIRFDKIFNLYYPHFSVEYKGRVAKFANDLSLIEGSLPVFVTYYIINWAMTNYEMLDGYWLKVLSRKSTLILNINL